MFTTCTLLILAHWPLPPAVGSCASSALMDAILQTAPIWLAIVCIAIVVFAFATAEEMK